MHFRSLSSTTLLRSWFALSAAFAIPAVLRLIQIPNTTQDSVVMGFTAARLALIAVPAAGGGMFLLLALAPARTLDPLVHHLRKPVIFFIAWGLFLALFTFTGYSATAGPVDYRPLHDRLLPPLAWLTGVSLLATLALAGPATRAPRQTAGRTLALLVFFLTFTIAWIPRSLDLDRFVTIDETGWLEASEEFFLALSRGDYAASHVAEHPAVTLMWAESFGFWWRLSGIADSPEVSHLTSHQLEDVYQRNGFSELDLLVAGRYAVGLVSALSIAGSAVLAIGIFGAPAALAGGLLLALDPFHIGHTRLLTMDGLLASLMGLSTIAFISWLHTRRTSMLLISGAAAGFSWLTKTPGIFLVPMTAAAALPMFFTDHRETAYARRLLVFVRAFLVWGLTALLCFFVFFPALWQAPIATLTDMITETLRYASVGHSGPVFYGGQIFPDGQIPGVSFALVNFLWRTTIPVLIGLAGTLWAAARQPREHRPVLLLLIAALVFILLQSAGTKKFDRYFLAAYPLIDFAAGFGLVYLLAGLRRIHAAARASTVAGLILLSLWPVIGTYPYFLSYYNPLLGGAARAPETMMIGWGEGLDQAGRYLNALPGAKNLKVVSWYNRGSFSYYFVGESENLPTNRSLTQSRLDHIMGMDYAVIYIHQWQRNMPPNLLAQLLARQPVHTITIDGIEYVRIYALDGR